MNTPDVKPLWTTRLYPPKTGRDHLGLGSVSSSQILAFLSPGINVLSVHPRYFSFYVFLLDEFWNDKDRPRSYSEWRKFFRPRAFIYSAACAIQQLEKVQPLGSIIGGRKVNPLVNMRPEALDVTFQYIESGLGGYGLYYRNPMVALGLVLPGGPGLPLSMDVPTPDLGKSIAAGFKKAIQGTEYYRKYFSQDVGTVPWEVVADYGSVASLEHLQHPTTPDRPLLLDALLHGGHDESSRSRRETFRLFLEMCDQTQSFPIDELKFRQLIYFGRTSNGASFSPSPYNQLSARYWRMYQLREYYVFALNGLWTYLCNWGLSVGGDLQPKRLDTFIQHLEPYLDFTDLADYLGIPRPKHLGLDADFQSLLLWLQEVIGAHGEEFDQACSLHSPFNEHVLYEMAMKNQHNPTIMVAGLLVMLGTIYLRINNPARRSEPEWAICRMGSDGRRSVDEFVNQMDGRVKPGFIATREVLRWLFNEYVIMQHILVANSKLPDNTFRFRREANGISFYHLPTFLGFQSARFDAITTMIHESGLAGDLRLTDHHLTDEGKRLLEQGDLP